MYSLEFDSNLLIQECDLLTSDYIVSKYHRTTGKINRLSHIVSYQVYYGWMLLGCITFSRPSGRWSSDINVVEISRICFTPYNKNTKLRRKLYKLPSFLVDTCCSAVAHNQSVDMFVTYTHENESGAYLEHCGFVQDGSVKHSKNSAGWNTRPGRIKSDLKTKKRFIRGEINEW